MAQTVLLFLRDFAGDLELGWGRDIVVVVVCIAVHVGTDAVVAGSVSIEVSVRLAGMVGVVFQFVFGFESGRHFLPIRFLRLNFAWCLLL